jgi:hypothetical protein
MIDIYKRLGLSPDASELAVQQAIAKCQDKSVQTVARDILLTKSRRNYDVYHENLSAVGQLRANFGQSSSALWLETSSSDFDRKPSDIPSYLEQLRKSPQPPAPPSTSGYIWLVAAVGIICLFLLLSSLREPSNYSTPSLSTGEQPSQGLQLPAPAVNVESLMPESTLPETGVVSANPSFIRNGEAPTLHIKTGMSTGNVLAKVIQVSSGAEVARLFVAKGQIGTVQLAPGLYTVKYAAGQRWYGEELLFGSETLYAKADKQFALSETAESYSVLTVELILQQDGNLRTRRIPANEF